MTLEFRDDGIPFDVTIVNSTDVYEFEIINISTSDISFSQMDYVSFCDGSYEFLTYDAPKKELHKKHSTDTNTNFVLELWNLFTGDDYCPDYHR